MTEFEFDIPSQGAESTAVTGARSMRAHPTDPISLDSFNQFKALVCSVRSELDIVPGDRKIARSPGTGDASVIEIVHSEGDQHQAVFAKFIRQGGRIAVMNARLNHGEDYPRASLTVQDQAIGYYALYPAITAATFDDITAPVADRAEAHLFEATSRPVRLPANKA